MTSMSEDKKQILELVKEYYNHYHKETDEYSEGDRIAYAGRVYDEEEMVNLVDSAYIGQILCTIRKRFFKVLRG